MFFFDRIIDDISVFGHYLPSSMHGIKISEAFVLGSECSWILDRGITFLMEPMTFNLIKNCICSAFAGGMKCAKRNFSSCSVVNVQFIRFVDHRDGITTPIAQ